MKLKYKWQYEISDRVEKMGNRELFESLLDLAAGDDWDGHFTPHGSWEFDYLKDAFERRFGRLLDEK